MAVSDDMECVSSALLERTAVVIRARRTGPQVLPGLGVRVTAAQMDAAARILKEAEPCSANGQRSERPGFLDRRDQTDPNALYFRTGIVPSTLYRIDRRGRVTEMSQASSAP